MSQSKPASQESIDELSEKLDLIFFAQAEILVRMKQTPEESQHYPLYQTEALGAAVGMEQGAIKEAYYEMLAQLASTREPSKRATVRQLRPRPGTIPETL